MVFDSSFKLPTLEEVVVPEVKLGTGSLVAGGNHMGLYCQKQNDEFMLCFNEEGDARKCLPQGRDVTSCAIEFFGKVKMHCLESFERYANCVDKGSDHFEVTRCRNTQVVFDGCMMEHLDLHRPTFGYYCKARIVDTERPKPVGYVIPDFPDKPTSSAPREGGRDRAIHGTRVWGGT